MSVFNIIAPVLVLMLSEVSGGLICKPNITIPKWYEPEYENVPISVATWTTTRNEQNDTVIPDKHILTNVGHFGIVRAPIQAFTYDLEIANSADVDVHILNVTFNGTDVCLAINNIEPHDAYNVQECEERCIKPFLTTAEEIVFFRDPVAKTRDILIIRTTHPNYKSAVRCWEKSTPHTDDMPFKSPGLINICPLGTKCMVSLVQTEQSSPTHYHAGCTPNDTNICSSPECANNTLAPHIGNGTFHRVCNFCCGYNNCNDIRNCTNDSCRFYGQPIQPTSPTTTTATDPSNSCNIHSLSLLVLLFSMLS